MYGGGGGGLIAKSCPTLATPWAIACQAPLSVGFSRQEYWSEWVALSFSIHVHSSDHFEGMVFICF